MSSLQGRTTFKGTLFQYSSSDYSNNIPSNLVAFESDPDCPRKCILLGGLSDGLIPTPYTKDLEEKLASSSPSWSLVQPLLSSSYLGFGSGDLNRDSQELTLLLLYLKQNHGAKSVALIGHSTGCQNIVHWLKHHYYKHPRVVESSASSSEVQQTSSSQFPIVEIAVLQAPVSDREGAIERPDYHDSIQYARSRKNTANGLEELMPRSAFWAPITVKRYMDLFDVDGEDDFFSSDLTMEQLVERLGHVSRHHNSSSSSSLKAVLVAFSGADEYVSKHIMDREELTQRLCDAMNFHLPNDFPPLAIPFFIPSGNHNLSEASGDAISFVDKVVELLLTYNGAYYR